MRLAGNSVAKFGVRLSPPCVRAGAEVAEHQHAFLVRALHHFGKEIVFQARLLRNDAVLIPGVAVARDAEGLNDIGAQRPIPRDMSRWIGVGPEARLGETIRTAWPPVEIKVVGFDVLRNHWGGGRRSTRKHIEGGKGERGKEAPYL